MAELPRLNGIIAALEAKRPVFTCFQPAEVNNAINIATSKYDGVVFEMEHQVYDGGGFRHALQYLLNHLRNRFHFDSFDFSRPTTTAARRTSQSGPTSR